MRPGTARPRVRRFSALLTTLIAALATTAGALPATAFATTFGTPAATFGGPGTVIGAGSKVYVKSGSPITLTVNTDNQATCVDPGSFGDFQTAKAGKTTWTFSGTAAVNEGTQTVSVLIGEGSNKNTCSTRTATATAAYVVDNTGPTLTPALDPAPRNGWNNTNATISWSAVDPAGVASTSSPQSFTTNGIFTASGTATDQLGNSSTAGTTVRIDKSAPTVAGTRAPAANSFGWNNGPVTVTWSCVDNPQTNASGLAANCPAPTVVNGDGADQTVTSPSVADLAGNSTAGSVSGISIDTTKPTLSGGATTRANDNGWYNGDVVMHWTAADVLSGVEPGTVPADATLSGEGRNLVASASVSDKAGNITTAISAPVNIDRTAPATSAIAPSGWTNQDATVTLAATDNLSGVANTYYTVDGGDQQAGTSIILTAEGDHAVSFWSVDNAGNTEAKNTIHVLVDKTAPTISHLFAPLANLFGWNNSDVTVTFTCADDLAGVKSCTAPQTVSAEGQGQVVAGTATDNAGNTATDPATVNIDKTKPLITASADRQPNGNGWYDAPVTVTYSCADALSGVKDCSAPATVDEDGIQSASGTATDAAGNSASATLGDLHIDQAPPTIIGTVVTKANANGWYDGAVTVHWTCSDAGSGLDGDCPADSVVTSEGANQSVTATVHDRAGNTAVGTVRGIDIDLTAPRTTAHVPDPLSTGWYATAVPVTLTVTDAISGVDTTYYTVDGGVPQRYGDRFEFGDKGRHTITYWSTDNAGNTEDAGQASQTLTLKLDGVPPTIHGEPTSSPNANGWYDSDVTVHFTCSDAESDIKSCSPDTTLTDSKAGQSVTGSAIDNAGNGSTDTVTGVNIDKVAPALSGAPTTAANAEGWYRDDVTIHWTAGDALSGVDAATVPADSVISAEGAGLTAGASVSDLAGNTTTAASQPVRIDRTVPTIDGNVVTDPSAAGWYNGDVTVHWTCADDLSGVGSCPDDSTITGEGKVLSVTGTASDKAGNSSSKTVGDINIDRTAPTTTVAAPDGWNNNSVTVSLDANDNLSGVKTTHYQIGTGDRATFGDVQTGDAVTVDSDGVYTLRYWSVDNAGNVEAAKTVQVKVDKTAPTISHELSPQPNSAGWNNADVTVTFTCGDNLSGVESCTSPVHINTEGRDQDASGAATDNAGNTTTDPVTVSLDQTAPTITGSADRPANRYGWYNGDVTVHFSCADGLSGVQTCPGDAILKQGAGQNVAGTAVDAAGNSSLAEVNGVNVDKAAPSLEGAPTTAPNDNGWYNGDVTVHWTCADALSGIDGNCPADSTVTGSGDNLSSSATVADRSGNSTSRVVSGLRIDRRAPETAASVADALPSGWYAGPVQVSLSAIDDLSGVAATSYRIDGGDVQPYDGPFTDRLGGIHTITYWSTDEAGNAEQPHSLIIKIDNVPPTVSAHASPDPNGRGWNNTAVTVSFTCTDDESGVASCPSPVTVDGPAKARAVSGTAVDNAGNTATATVNGINVDQDTPVLIGRPTTEPNAAGWYDGNVTVRWNCSDATSGIAGDCPADSTVTGEGADLSATASVGDNADNTTTAAVTGLQIDRTAPVTQADSPSAWVNANVTVALSATDNLSGVAATHYSVNGGETQTGTSVELGEGTWTLTYWSVDAAGNSESPKTTTVRIDKTAPVISHELQPEPNAAGWNNADVTVTFTCTDDANGSGVAACTGAQHVTTEGRAQQIRGSATDNAGNSASDTAEVSVDKTAPVISAAPDRTPDANGWYNHDLTVTFTCSDNLSGTTCPSPARLGEGPAESASGTATDVAGNQASAAVGPLQIDETAPTLSGTADRTGWTNGDVTVHWTCRDALSGIAPGDCPGESTVTGEGENLSTTAAVSDVAGNTTATTVSGIQIDRTAPATNAMLTGNAFNGWYAGPATVALSTDSDLSGVAKTLYTVDGGDVVSYDKPFQVGGGRHVVKFWSVDNAGNAEKVQSVSINVDNIAPAITGATTSQPNGNGWYSHPVTVHFTCTDGETGVANCPADVTVDKDAAGQYVSGTVTDRAGNATSVKVGPISLDQVAPSVALGGVADGATYVLGDVPAPSCTAADGLSGLTGACTGKVDASHANGDGTGSYTYTASATDKAGNVTTVSATYQVTLRWDGFLQPVSNKAPDNVLKAGSTVPLKFQLKNASGAIVQPSWAPTVTSVTQGAAISGTAAPVAYSTSSMIGSSFRYDSTDQQWIYNWSTKGLPAGYYYTVGVKLDDGTTKTVTVALR